MILREPSLKAGWYPTRKELIEEFLAPFKEGNAFTCDAAKKGQAAVAPHAGWYYSGVTAARAVASLDSAAETVAIIGGHLPRGGPILMAEEEWVKTPLGDMEIDMEFSTAFNGDELRDQFRFRPDNYHDNTVEVLVPMVHYFFPDSKLLWLRFPADLSSFDAGKLLAETAEILGRRLVVVASTDLTHYGVSYGFSPAGFGQPALDWVKNVNDAAFIDAALSGDPRHVLSRAEEDRSACSAGAVLGALGFVSSMGLPSRGHSARLLDYSTSADASGGVVPDSFVGYAAIAFGSGE